jgi:hypothetical protein
MSSCYCDYEPAEFFSKKFRHAKKEHKCCECGKVIHVGDEYEYVAGKWEGDIMFFKTCEKCSDLRSSLDDVGCPYYGGLYEEYWEYLQNVLPTMDAVRIKYNEVMKK